MPLPLFLKSFALQPLTVSNSVQCSFVAMLPQMQGWCANRHELWEEVEDRKWSTTFRCSRINVQSIINVDLMKCRCNAMDSNRPKTHRPLWTSLDMPQTDAVPSHCPSHCPSCPGPKELCSPCPSHRVVGFGNRSLPRTTCRG